MAYLSEEVVVLHGQGLTQRQIATQLSCGLNTVRRRMKEQNLEGQSKGARDFVINSHVFDAIDTEEKAYWLGFFLADACIAESAGTRRAFRLSLKRGDKKHLQKAAKFLNHRGPLHPDNRDNHPRLVIVFNDISFCSRLMNNGWWNYKIGISFEILDTVPRHLFHHFIRGYYDGDGCISYRVKKRKDGTHRKAKQWYCNITCKYAGALEIMNKYIIELNGPMSETKPRGTVYDLRWSNKNRVSNILEWMYKDATIYLERKMSRRHEFDGLLPFTFNSICDFTFNIRTDDLLARKDHDNIIAAFTAEVIESKWKPPRYDYQQDLNDAFSSPDLLEDGVVVSKSAAGNKFILQYQPIAWYIRQNRSQAIADCASHRKILCKAINNFCFTPSRGLTPQRFVRELRFAGFTMASLLSVPVILSAIKYFGLSGKWFDPCAGWGNRLLAAYILDLKYEATDPGVSFNGLVKMNKDLGTIAKLHNQKWEDFEWNKSDFILTSPPFHNKEDYLDNAVYGKFDDWYQMFLKPLVLQSLNYSNVVVLHIDKPMRNALDNDFVLDALPILSISRHKAPKEWFVKITTS